MQCRQNRHYKKGTYFLFLFCVNIHQRHKDEAVKRDDEVINLN